MSLDNYRSAFPFEFCAARFLRQWEKHEEAQFSAISQNPTDADIVKALRYFQVARNFKELSKKPDVPAKIRSALLQVRNDVSLTTPVGKVDALAESLEHLFFQFNLSAATKLLWFSYRAPYVVYDRRAVSALSKRANHQAIARNYAKYTVAWRMEYTRLEAAIEAAIENLPNGRGFMPQTVRTDAQLVALSKDAWFKERVFDIFLWEVGGNE